MRMFHCTTRTAWRLICRDARLRADKAVGRRKAVWMVPEASIPWAMLHVCKRHGKGIADVVVIELDVPRSWLRRHARGRWFCPRDIPLVRAVRIRGWIEVAA